MFLPGCVLARPSCQAHRYLTKLFIGSALVSAMYGRELGFHLFIVSMDGGWVPARWVSPIVRWPLKQVHTLLRGITKCPCTVGGPAAVAFAEREKVRHRGIGDES